MTLDGSDIAGSDTIAPSDDPIEFLEWALAKGWGDGLPLVPPTPSRVDRLLTVMSADPAEVVGVLPPRNGVATLRSLAANAVMAGVEPAAFPIVVAAVQAMADPAFNLTAVQSTTHPVAPLVMVHGSIRQRAGINSGTGAFGPGHRGNATVGRAVRLALLNIGGGRPGDGDFSTQGNPAKYAYCAGENSEDNPWISGASDFGEAGSGQDAVTVIPAEAPRNLNDHVAGSSALHILELIAASMAVPSINNPYSLPTTELWVLLCPEHARTIAGGGFQLADVQRFLFERARLSLKSLRAGGMYGSHDWPIWMDGMNDDAMLPIAHDSERIRIAVVGGAGKHSCWLPTNGASRSVTRQITTESPSGGAA